MQDSTRVCVCGVVPARYGGLTGLLSKFPDHFVLENDAPFNHVSLRTLANASSAMAPAPPAKPGNRLRPWHWHSAVCPCSYDITMRRY